MINIIHADVEFRSDVNIFKNRQGYDVECVVAVFPAGFDFKLLVGSDAEIFFNGDYINPIYNFNFIDGTKRTSVWVPRSWRLTPPNNEWGEIAP